MNVSEHVWIGVSIFETVSIVAMFGLAWITGKTRGTRWAAFGSMLFAQSVIYLACFFMAWTIGWVEL